MDTATLLWVDLQAGTSGRALDPLDVPNWRAFRHVGCEGLTEAIHRSNPSVLFFEYDYPTPLGLRTLEQIRKAFPQLPLFMVTEEHSEDLAVWAFRTGVRDFLIKPIEARDITSRLQRLPEPRQSNSPARSNILPQQSIPPAARYAAPALPKMTARAVRYMESRLQERITLEQMALFCGMSPFQLSRAFKREHGVNFKEFLTRQRVAKAMELLANPRAAVADIASAVGFSDPSYFAKVFRRLVGRLPSDYREGGAISGLVCLSLTGFYISTSSQACSPRSLSAARWLGQEGLVVAERCLKRRFRDGDRVCLLATLACRGVDGFPPPSRRSASRRKKLLRVCKKFLPPDLGVPLI